MQGTTFRIYLPLLSHVAESLHLSGKSGRTPEDLETILLVEDEAAVRKMGRQLLSCWAYHVLTAANGAEASALAEVRETPHRSAADRCGHAGHERPRVGPADAAPPARLEGFVAPPPDMPG